MKTKMNVQWFCLSFQNTVVEKATQKKTDIICPHHLPVPPKKREMLAVYQYLSDLDFFWREGQQTKTQTKRNFHLIGDPVLCPIILSINLNVKKLPIK